MRYTPGPWEVFGDHEVKAVYGKMFMDDSELCPVMRLGQGVNTKANGLLIAQAPSMLEALKECRNVILVEHCLNASYGWKEWVEEHIDPIIRAAEGDE